MLIPTALILNTGLLNGWNLSCTPNPFLPGNQQSSFNAYECLELAGIKDLFSIIITRDDVQHGKPAPDIFLKAAGLLHVPINLCLVLGDFMRVLWPPPGQELFQFLFRLQSLSIDWL